MCHFAVFCSDRPCIRKTCFGCRSPLQELLQARSLVASVDAWEQASHRQRGSLATACPNMSKHSLVAKDAEAQSAACGSHGRECLVVFQSPRKPLQLCNLLWTGNAERPRPDHLAGWRQGSCKSCPHVPVPAPIAHYPSIKELNTPQIVLRIPISFKVHS